MCPGSGFLVRIYPIHFLDRCPKRRLRRVSLVFLGLVAWVSYVYIGCCRCALSVPAPSDWLERLVPKVACYMSSGTLSSTHCLPYLVCQAVKGSAHFNQTQYVIYVNPNDQIHTQYTHTVNICILLPFAVLKSTASSFVRNY